jgi:hypothetical protein
MNKETKQEGIIEAFLMGLCLMGMIYGVIAILYTFS